MRTQPKRVSVVRAGNPLNWPEASVAFFAFVLHFSWELLQMPFYSPQPHFTTRDVILNCTLAQPWGTQRFPWVPFGARLWQRVDGFGLNRPGYLGGSWV
jgi:hypothetical protein